MSTKTTFKRVALVAVAALGFGVLSVAPSSATAIAINVAPSATTSAIKTGETATINLTVSGVIVAANDSITVNAAVTQGASGSVKFLGTTDSTTANIREGVANYANSITIDREETGGTRAVVQANFVNPTTAGVYQVLFYTTANNSSVQITPFTWTITVTADSVNADTSSSSRMVAGLWTAQTDPAVDAVVSAAKDASGAVATIKVVQANATASANEGMVVLISGPGFLASQYLANDTATASGANRVLSIPAPGVGVASYVKVLKDGTPGTTTVTFTGATSGVVIASKTITFSDTKPTSVSAAVAKAFIKAGAATTDVFAVTVKDAAGNAITDTAATVTGTRSDTTTAGKAIATADLSCSWNATGEAYHCTATGTSAAGFGPAGYTITATGTDAAATKVTTTASTTFSDVVATTVTVTAPATD